MSADEMIDDGDAYTRTAEAKNWRAPDGVLQSLVVDANSSTDPDNRTGITVIVHGALITGFIIPSWRWFEIESAEIREMNEVPEDTETIFDDLVETLRHVDYSDDAEVARTSYLHLGEAVVMVGGVPVPAARWRIALADVSGWMLRIVSINPA